MARNHGAYSYFPAAEFDTLTAGKWNPKLIRAVAAFEPFRQLSGDKVLADQIGVYDAQLGAAVSGWLTGLKWVAPGNSTASFLSVSHYAALAVTNLDIRVKVTPVSLTPGSIAIMVSKWGASQNCYEFDLDTTGKLALYWSTTGANTVGPSLSTATLASAGLVANVPIYLRATLVVASGTATFYYSLDGLVWTQLGTTVVTGATSIFAGTAALQTGYAAGAAGSAAANAFTGGIQWVQLRNGVDGTVVYDTDLQALADGITSFTENSSNAQTVTVTTPAAGTDDPTFDGTRMTFDGVNDYAYIPYQSSLSPGTTISAMVGVKAASQLDKALFGQFDTNAKRTWLIVSNGSNGALADIFISADGGTTNAKKYTTTKTVFDNTDHTVGMTYNGATGTLKVYVDGVEDTAVTKSTDATVSTLFSTNVNLTLGAYLATGATTGFLSGSITAAYLCFDYLSSPQMMQLHDYIRQSLAVSSVSLSYPPIDYRSRSQPVELFGAATNIQGVSSVLYLTSADFTTQGGGVSTIILNHTGPGTGTGNKRTIDSRNNGTTTFSVDKTGLVTSSTLTSTGVVYAGTGGTLINSSQVAIVASGNLQTSGASSGYKFGSRDATIDYQWYSSGSLARLFNHTASADVLTVSGLGLVTAASFAGAVGAKTANYTATLGDECIVCDPTTASFTITLPAVSGTSGKRYLIKKEGSTNNTVTVDANASETIDGALTFVIRGRQETCEIISNGTEWKRVTNPVGLVPVGGIVAWHKSFTNTPALPNEFVECNGQTLSDAGSVYGGGAQVIPNLNGNGATQKYLLRGSTTSGTTGGNDLHTHTITTSTTTSSVTTGSQTYVTSVTSPSGTASAIPAYFEVVWVMRIK